MKTVLETIRSGAPWLEKAGVENARLNMEHLLAKVLEHYDRQIFEFTGMVSGHTLKHVVAGLAGFPVAYLLWHRRLQHRGGHHHERRL